MTDATPSAKRDQKEYPLSFAWLLNNDGLPKKVYTEPATGMYKITGVDSLRNDLKTPLCHSELVSESPYEGNNPDEILKQVQDDTLVYVLG